jgi:secreted trypsin-like serine protease
VVTAAIVIAWASISGCSAPAERETGVAASPLVNAHDDADDPPVVALMRGGSSVCSGTLIAPKAVLTAAHCLTLAPIAGVFVGEDPAGDGRTLAADRAVVHPGYDPTTLANDVGILWLAEGADEADVATMVSAGEAVSPGGAARMVGFGVTQAASNVGPRTKHEGEATVAVVRPTSFDLTPDPAQACTGDSGGAVFATFGGEERLAGVISAGDGLCSSFTRAERVDAYRVSFIDASLNGGGCAMGRRPVDARAALLLGLALALGVRRRRALPRPDREVGRGG